MYDLRAVMSAAGLERAAVLATFEAGPMATLFAATYPERVGALALFNPSAKGVRSPDYPWGRTPEQWRKELADLEAGWGTCEYFDRVLARSYPSAVGDESFRNWFINMMRYGASPGAALNVHRMAMDVDIRPDVDHPRSAQCRTCPIHGRAHVIGAPTRAAERR
jgi:pimeloyl-ACP methyl ester carboxylesterase